MVKFFSNPRSVSTMLLRLWFLVVVTVPVTFAQPPPPGGGGGGGSNCQDTACNTKPCPANCLGDVGLTTASGTDASATGANTKSNLQVGENIYGPFEAGFSSQQDNILSGLGCASGRGYVDGGIDTNTAEEIVAKDCGVTLPRWTGGSVGNGEYISLLRVCGGHTAEYHFHERLSCLYDTSAAGHSTQVGREDFSGSATKLLLYGKYESTGTPPTDLDACGGHFGINPDSGGQSIYHYHVQDKAPFTFGCHGPDKDSQGNEIKVTVARCRELYPSCKMKCIENVIVGDTRAVAGMPTGTHLYHRWCPCFDSNGRNVENGAVEDTSECPVSGVLGVGASGTYKHTIGVLVGAGFLMAFMSM